MSLGADTIPIISSIAEIGSTYRAWLVDIWGVMHNGVRSFPRAVEATTQFRKEGGIVVLLSNSPRPSESLQAQLRGLGVHDESYDTTVSSGDLTRHELGKRGAAPVFHLGPDRDLPIFENLAVKRVAPEEAELVVCTGLFNDDTETPEDYDELLAELAGRKLTMLCANPDRMVERGHSLVYCAGALAENYAAIGGRVIYAGKPYAPIYDLAFETVSGLTGRGVQRSEFLAIGDGVHTDMAGAAEAGLDAVFVLSGLHLPGGTTDSARAVALDEELLAELFEAVRPPRAAMPALAW